MRKEFHLKINITTFKKYFILIIPSIIILLLLFTKVFNCPCLIKKILGIRCPSCGLTRAMRCLFQLDILSSMKYNILSVPLILILIIEIFIFLLDKIKQTKYFDNFNTCLIKNYKVIIFILLISMSINNINKI